MKFVCSVYLIILKISSVCGGWRSLERPRKSAKTERTKKIVNEKSSN